MRRPIALHITQLGGDPGDEVWRWFTTNGPHGSTRFNWSKAKNQPGAYVPFEHLQQIVAEQATQIDDFERRACDICALALRSTSSDFVVRALQIAAAIEAVDLLEEILPLMSSLNGDVAAHARACVHQLRRARL